MKPTALIAFCLLIVVLPVSALVSCSGAKNTAAETAAPDCLKCALEVVPVFAVKAPEAGAEGGAK